MMGRRIRSRRLLLQVARRLWGAGIVAVALAAPSAQAATFGHARLASAAGQPLAIVIPVTGLTAADAQSLSARAAPAAAWAQAGLTPPVALDTLAVTVAPGPGGGTNRVLRVHSSQAFSGTLADVLLDVQTPTGSQRYQVSLVGPGPARATEGAAAQNVPSHSRSAVGTAPAARRAPVARIRVRPGDTMLALARQHAVRGVSVYQLMLALQRANPQAFIHQNINLVRAGATLSVPSIDDMLSISDAEARRQFMAQVAAFDRLRGRTAAAAAAVQAGQGAAGTVSPVHGSARAAAPSRSHDQLRLSEGRNDKADARAARGHALKDAESRVGQLQDNVQNLNQALQVQGEAARSVAADGANAIGNSIQKIAGAISQASHEAAAQAADRTASSAASQGAADGGPPGAPAAGSSTPGGVGGQAPATGLQSGPPVAAAGTASSGAAAGQAAGGAAASSAHDPLFNAAGSTPANQAQAHANAEAAEQHASEQTRHRVNWLQDHLLGVMTGLLALIVFIIAWLLRRANAARDEADADPQVTEAMVQEKLRGIDLDLPPAEPRVPPSDA